MRALDQQNEPAWMFYCRQTQCQQPEVGARPSCLRFGEVMVNDSMIRIITVLSSLISASAFHLPTQVTAYCKHR
jgi:hypothetical protein